MEQELLEAKCCLYGLLLKKDSNNWTDAETNLAFYLSTDAQIQARIQSNLRTITVGMKMTQTDMNANFCIKFVPAISAIFHGASVENVVIDAEFGNVTATVNGLKNVDCGFFENFNGGKTLDSVITGATSAFWGEFATAFPEVTSGDSQLSGEDEAAVLLWAIGSTGDNPSRVFNLPVDWVSKERLDDALIKCMAATAAVLFEGDVPAAPPLAVDLFRDCIAHVLHFNPPVMSA